MATRRSNSPNIIGGDRRQYSYENANEMSPEPWVENPSTEEQLERPANPVLTRQQERDRARLAAQHEASKAVTQRRLGRSNVARKVKAAKRTQ